MEDIIYITSDYSGMTEEDLRLYIKELKSQMSDFEFENWFSIENFIDKGYYYRLREELN